METEVYGQVPIFSREQLRKQYAKAVKSNFDNFSLEDLVEEGVMPFPNDEEMTRYDEGIEKGLNHVLSSIEKSDAVDLPEFFMIDTERRDQRGKGAVWVVAGGEVIDFTRTPVVRSGESGA